MVTARRLITWSKTPIGKFALFVVLLLVGLSVFAYASPNFYEKAPEKQEKVLMKSKTIYDKGLSKFSPTSGTKTIYLDNKNKKNIKQEKSIIKTLPPAEQNNDLSRQNQRAQGRFVSTPQPVYQDSANGRVRKEVKEYSMPVLDLYTSTESFNDIPLGEYFAPYGRIMKLQLINTIDSASGTSAPVVGILRESVYHNGLEILPAGLEIHGFSAGPLRDRIKCQKTWIAVWRTPGQPNYGKELKFTGIAIEDGEVSNSGHYTIESGSLGLKGYTIDTTVPAKLFSVASTFLAGMGQGYVESKVTSSGVLTEQTFGGDLQSGLGQATNRSATLLAQIMLDEIQKNGYYVRVPGGTNFNIYCTQTLSLAEAKKGGSSS